MEPWQSWVVVGVAGVGAQKTNGRVLGRVLPATVQPQAAGRRIDTKGKRNKGKSTNISEQAVNDTADVTSASLNSSGNEKTKKRKGGKKTSSGPTKLVGDEVGNDTTPSLNIDEGEADGMDNVEFARQLSGVKAGTSLSAPAKSSQSRKTKKLGQANGIVDPESIMVPVHKDLSTPSSTTGADGDDDLSPTNSPPLGPATTSAGKGGVADMLEAPMSGPSILRLTEPIQPPRPSQPKTAKPVQAEETKKQRQNRQKNEARKLERQEAEKERRVLLEKQLRTAREAEGRPAKNGVPVSKPPATNRWAPPSTDSESAQPTPEASGNSSRASLLDTFEESSKPAVPDSRDGRLNGKASAEKKLWEHDMPSEEEQMRMLTELNGDGWQTVEKPKKRDKSSVAGTEEIQSIKGVNHSKVEEDDFGVGKNNGKEKIKENEKPISKVDDRGYRDGKYVPYAETGHPLDSDWPVA
ncbi:MAG: hypothetical protein Q9187_001739 [Circinaria calcarea]